MRFIVRTGVVLFTVVSLILPAFAAQGAKRPSDELKHDIGELKNNPADRVLREKIIKTVTNMKQPPAVPEEAERNMARGTAFAQKASDNTGYRKAIMEFEAALNAAPWLALAYYNLGVVQEKSGLFNEAIQNLKFYLLAAPNAKNAREVKNKIYALEAEAEAVQAGMNAPESAPDAPAGGKQLSVTGKPTLEIEPDKELKIIKMPLDQKTKMYNFAGNWYLRKTSGRRMTFMLLNHQNECDLTLIPPKRA
jgi:tetratricopeptide (TPR) repeat protein